MTLSELHKISPYADFPLSEYKKDVRGWNYQDDLFAILVDQTHPRLAVEVGTWLGGSALATAAAIKAQGRDGKLLCVDTWLGSLEFWENHDDNERYGALNLRHGYPQCYFQFIANVMHSELDDVVIPFPQTSLTAAAWLFARGKRADLIYLDGSHDQQQVEADLWAWWKNLGHGGVIFGDDYDTWEGVRFAVKSFAEAIDKPVELRNGKWIVRK